MNNQELELKVKELVKIENFFDLLIAAKQFKQEYKNSEFYKTTHMPFEKMLEKALVYYKINLSTMLEKVQSAINNLDAEHLVSVFDKIADVFSAENKEVQDILEQFKTTLK